MGHRVEVAVSSDRGAVRARSGLAPRL